VCVRVVCVCVCVCMCVCVRVCVRVCVCVCVCVCVLHLLLVNHFSFSSWQRSTGRAELGLAAFYGKEAQDVQELAAFYGKGALDVLSWA